jgi:CubicO group peptidase (beta-lactamase class C family)
MKTITIAGLIVTWIAFVCLVLFAEDRLSQPDLAQGDIKSLEEYLTRRFTQALVDKTLGCGGFAIIQHGKIVDERGFGIANPESNTRVNVDSTLFLLSSLSKAVTAWGVMKLVEDQKIGLDDAVYKDLRRWNFSAADTLARKVTVRHLLSHTAGIIDGYGHAGVDSRKAVQTIEQSLSYPNDVNSGESHGVAISFTPGSGISYSSAGYAVLQLLIEEKTGIPFNVFMREQILAPLGMRQSTFRLEDIEDENRTRYLAAQYDLELNVHPHRYYSNHAGVSLRSSIHDLALLAEAYSKPNEILSEPTIKEFHTPQAGTSNTWAIGHMLYQKNAQGDYLFGHGGGAFPASGADMRINPSSGNAIVLVATGSQNFISPLADDWMYWETGQKKIFDVRDVIRKRGLIGGILIIFGSIVIIVWRNKRAAPPKK